MIEAINHNVLVNLSAIFNFEAGCRRLIAFNPILGGGILCTLAGGGGAKLP